MLVSCLEQLSNNENEPTEDFKILGKVACTNKAFYNAAQKTRILLLVMNPTIPMQKFFGSKEAATNFLVKHQLSLNPQFNRLRSFDPETPVPSYFTHNLFVTYHSSTYLDQNVRWLEIDHLQQIDAVTEDHYGKSWIRDDKFIEDFVQAQLWMSWSIDGDLSENPHDMFRQVKCRQLSETEPWLNDDSISINKHLVWQAIKRRIPIFLLLKVTQKALTFRRNCRACL